MSWITQAGLEAKRDPAQYYGVITQKEKHIFSLGYLCEFDSQ